MFEQLYSLKDHSPRSIMIDAWRGFAMLLVMLQHNGSHHFVTQALLQFHMPLFFIISGFMLDRASTLRKHTFSSHIKKRFLQLIIPYLIFELIFLAAWFTYQGSAVNLEATLLSIGTVVNTSEATGLRLWFLPCLFVADCAAFMVLRCVNNKLLLLLISIAVYVGAWGLSIVHPERLPFMLDIGLVAFTYILIGYVIAPFLMKLEQGMSGKLLICTAILLFCTCLTCCMNNTPFLMYSHEYGNYAIAFVGACCGALATLILVSHIVPLSNGVASFFAWFGRNSLLLFPLHLLILNAMRVVQPVVDIPLAVRFLLLLALCIPLANLIDRHLPFLAGRSFKRKQSEEKKLHKDRNEQIRGHKA